MLASSAIGALGVFSTLPTLRADALFLADLVHTIPPLLVAGGNVMIRIRASWALANLCDAMSAPPDDVSASNDEDIGMLYAAAMTACRDTAEKCKGNGVRALGSLCTRLRGDGAREQEIVAVLIRCASAGAMKTRWNSLHALASVVACLDRVYVCSLILNKCCVGMMRGS